MELKNVKISELGQEKRFVSGQKNWRIEWAEINGEKFKPGDTVLFFDEDINHDFIGNIEWMIVTEEGQVEVSISDTPLGRIDLEDLTLIQSN